MRHFYCAVAAYSAFTLGGDELPSVGRWGLLSHLDRRKLRQAGRKNAENEVLTAFLVRRGLKSFYGLAERHHFQRFCDWMEHAPKTLCQRPGTRRALHSGRTHPCLHYGYDLRLHRTAQRLE